MSYSFCAEYFACSLSLSLSCSSTLRTVDARKPCLAWRTGWPAGPIFEWGPLRVLLAHGARAGRQMSERPARRHESCARPMFAGRAAECALIGTRLVCRAGQLQRWRVVEFRGRNLISCTSFVCSPAGRPAGCARAASKHAAQRQGKHQQSISLIERAPPFARRPPARPPAS